MEQNTVLDEPERCDNCLSINIEHKQGNSNKFSYDKKPTIWYCNSCGSLVGCHPGTTKPFGKMAPRHIRELRVKGHQAFDKLWKNGLLERKTAYRWLAKTLEIPDDECHFSWLTESQLNKAIIESDIYFNKIKSKRKLKKDKQNVQQQNAKLRIVKRKLANQDNNRKRKKARLKS